MWGVSFAIFARTTLQRGETRRQSKESQRKEADLPTLLSVTQLTHGLCLHCARDPESSQVSSSLLTGHVGPEGEEIIQRRQRQVEHIDKVLSELCNPEMSMRTNGAMNWMEIASHDLQEGGLS
jgi:hypothetical protein